MKSNSIFAHGGLGDKRQDWLKRKAAPSASRLPLILSLSKDERGSWFDKLTMSGSSAHV